MRTEHDSLQEKHTAATSELEMSKVHLTQLRGGAGQQDLLRLKEEEVGTLSQELAVTRANLMEAMARISQLGGERDSLAEQYRGYSRDPASQAERLGEQLAKYQQENARLVTREAGLVQHVTSLKTQLQGVVTQVLQGRECCQYAGDAGLEDQRVQVDGTVGQWDSAVGHGQAGGGLPE